MKQEIWILGAPDPEMEAIESLKRKLQAARAALEEIRRIVEYDSQRHGGTMIYDMITESVAKGLEGSR